MIMGLYTLHTVCHTLSKGSLLLEMHLTCAATVVHLPFQRVHIDFAGPFCGKMFFFLKLVDAHSKSPEVFIMSDTTTQKTL